jgi:hypothetical protein
VVIVLIFLFRLFHTFTSLITKETSEVDDVVVDKVHAVEVEMPLLMDAVHQAT